MAITGLVPGKQYEFRVYAENIYGRSEPSEPTTLVQTKAIIKKEFKKKEYPGMLATWSSKGRYLGKLQFWLVRI